MTDREMLLLAYGALKVSSQTAHNLKEVVGLVEEHLYPSVVVDVFIKTPYPDIDKVPVTKNVNV